jgi:hypothetical protein
MKKEDKLIQHLGEIKHKFQPGFENKVMAVVEKTDSSTDRVVSLWSYGVAVMAAASIALIMVTTFYSEGSISIDALLGLGGHDTIELRESLDTYTYVYNE